MPSSTPPDTGAPLGFVLRATLLAAAVGVVLFLGNGKTSPFDRDEARFALAVREMRARDDLVLPTNYGVPRYHKPILVYWLALGAERWLGPGPRAWRLPSSASGVLAVAATMLLARRRFGGRVALRAGAILGTSLVFLVETKILTADATLLATTTLAFWAWSELRIAVRPGRGWQVLFWVAIALGILAKGVNVVFLAAAAAALAFLRGLGRGRPPLAPRSAGLWLLAAATAAAIPGLGILGPLGFGALAVTVLVRAERGPRTRLGTAFGLPLCLALVALWLVPAIVRTGGAFVREGVGHHMLARSASPFEGHAGLPGYYLVTSLLALFPWGAWMPGALRAAWRDPRCDFLLAWILGPWALLECMASKLPHYVLVALPAAAVLLALHWDAATATSPRARRVQHLVFVLPWILVAGALFWAGTRLEGAARAWSGVVAGTALLAPLVALTLEHRRGRPCVAVVAGGAATLYLVLGAGLLPRYEGARIAPRLGAAVAAAARPAEAVCLVRYRPASLGCALPEGHAIVEDPERVAEQLESGATALFVVPADARDPRFATPDGLPLERWDLLATVAGLDGLRTRTLWLLRRGA